ncbi:hypothetical protein [Pseudokineococcus sp. 1T1Z-3]|uniref:hypothetical protein n=1 Tax=Pseudokineococcus sp. 1T1Z-3 TaxID=3132745 RepID=UPI0030B1CAA2
MPDATRSERLGRRRTLWSRLLGREGASGDPAPRDAAPAPSSEPARTPSAPPAPAAGPAEPEPLTTPLADVLAQWAVSLAEASGGSLLLDDRRAGADLVAPLDLGGAHPSGLAAFWAGRATRLSTLVRERGAHTAARERVRALRTAAQEVETEHAAWPGALAVGLVRWSAPADPGRGLPAVEVHAPALLQPLVLRPRGAGALDEELDLQPGPVVNPALVRLLTSRGHAVDVAAVLAPFADGRGDAHRRARGELAAQTADVQGLTHSERTLVGVYPDLAGGLADALASLTAGAAESAGGEPGEGPAVAGLPPLVTALAAASAGQRVTPGGRGGAPAPVRAWEEGARPPVLDLDEDQERALVALAAGRSVRLRALPGTGATQLVAQAVATAASSGRRCLVVAPALGEALAVTDRLARAGLADLVDRGDVPAGASLPVPLPLEDDRAAAGGASSGEEAATASALVARAAAAVQALERPPGDGLDAGVLQTAHALARLAQGPRPPRTPVRLDAAATSAVTALGLPAVLEAVRTAARLGAFRPELAEGPWEAAAAGDAGEVRQARDRADRLATELLPRLVEQLAALGEKTGLRPPATPAEAEQRLALLEGVRGTLEDFLPGVYERPLADLVRSLGDDAAWRTRRTAQKVVAEVVRPGARPSDLRTALRRADAERRAWTTETLDGGRPRVPAGLTGARRALGAVLAELDRIEPVLRPTRAGGRLRQAGLEELQARLRGLADDPDVRGDLPARVDVLVHLASLGLAPLVADVRSRGLDAEAAAAEAELCVRASALEEARRRGVLDDVLPGAGDALRGEHAGALARERAAEAAGLVETARRASAGGDAGRLVQCSSLLALPRRVDRSRLRSSPADLVVLLDASAAAVPEAALALACGRQVLVVGDPAGPPPATGAVGAPSPEVPGASARLDAWSATEGVLEEHVLRRRHRLPRQLEPVLAAVREQGADHVGGSAGPGTAATSEVVGRDGSASLVGSPAPPGARPVVLRHVEGRGQAGPEGSVRSLDVEVHAVVGSVLEHLRADADASLAVVALTRGHARRVADALREAVAGEPALAASMARASRQGEPLVVTDVARAAGCVRDVVVLATAFAPTERGRVLSSFGPLDAAGGAAALAEAAAGARRRLEVVTCLTSVELEPERLRTPGARALRALLAAVEQAAGEEGSASPAGVSGAGAVDVVLPGVADVDLPAPGDAAARALAAHASAVPPGGAASGGAAAGGAAAGDPLVPALVQRLEAAGARVRAAGRAGDPDLCVVRADGAAVAVLPDVRASSGPEGVVAADPLERGVEAAALAARGWAVVHVTTLGLLVDPAGEAARVLAAARHPTPAGA